MVISFDKPVYQQISEQTLMIKQENNQQKNPNENQFDISNLINQSSSLGHFQFNEIDASIDQQNALKKNEEGNFFEKIQYYNTLVRQNKQMHSHLESISRGLDQQIKQINNKKYTTVNKYKPAIKPQRSPILQAKYRELDEIKKQVELKIRQKRSIQQLICRVDELRAAHKQKFMQLQLKSRTLKKLQSLLSKNKKEEQNLKNSTLLVADSCILQIRELKSKIKATNDRVYDQRQKLISLARSNKKRNSQLQSYKQPISIQEPQSIVELKLQYQTIGKRIQGLKVKKKELTKPDNIKDRKQYLQKLKAKLIQLSKI